MFISDFWHINTRIAKGNLPFPLVTDTFTMLGSSKCEVLSVIRLKMPFTHRGLQKSQRSIVGYYPIFVVPLTSVKECQWNLIFLKQYGSHTSVAF